VQEKRCIARACPYIQSGLPSRTRARARARTRAPDAENFLSRSDRDL
jgi:hypothetical protein